MNWTLQDYLPSDTEIKCVSTKGLCIPNRKEKVKLSGETLSRSKILRSRKPAATPFAAKPTARTSTSTSTNKKPKYTDNNEYENDSKWAEIEQHDAIAENIIGGRDVDGRLTASDVAVASNNNRIVKVRVTSEQAELHEPTPYGCYEMGCIKQHC